MQEFQRGQMGDLRAAALTQDPTSVSSNECKVGPQVWATHGFVNSIK